MRNLIVGFICVLMVFICLPASWKAQIIHDVAPAYAQKVQVQEKAASLRDRQHQRGSPSGSGGLAMSDQLTRSFELRDQLTAGPAMHCPR